jgi:hypothetical protein
MPKAATTAATGKLAVGQCLCGEVCFEIDTPARWAWHDHSSASRRAHGAAYATYVGSWRKRFRITKGEAEIARFEDKASKTARSFCARCGTPLFYERPAFAAHGEHSACAVFRAHRPAAALSCRDRGNAGMDLCRRAAGATERFPGRGLATLEKEEALGSRGNVLIRDGLAQGSHDRASLISPADISHDARIAMAMAAGRGNF